jgi:hypothetical protein
MARAITAAALAGLFTPNQYRPGPFGGSVLDKGNTMAAAGQAGMALTQKSVKRKPRPDCRPGAGSSPVHSPEQCEAGAASRSDGSPDNTQSSLTP